jgi:cardiolipin synthase
MSQNGRRGQMTLPNALTLLRILMVPALLIAVIYNRTAIALVLFLIAAATDLLDGFLARRLGQKTVLGTYLDPLADKLLMAVCFISLAVVRLLPAWLAVLAVSKDLFVSLGLGILYFTGRKLSPVPTRWGKLTTFLQMTTVGLSLLWPVASLDESSLWPLFLLTGFLTVLSGLHYILQGIISLPSENDNNGGGS